MAREGRLTTNNWDLYDTRHVVFQPARLTPRQLKEGYDWAYREFYRWSSIAAASFTHGTVKHRAKHFAYSAGWKKFEFLWNAMIRARQLRFMTPVLEAVLSKVSAKPDRRSDSVTTKSRFGTLGTSDGSQAFVPPQTSLAKTVIHGPEL
jgi:hypothetical protein